MQDASATLIFPPIIPSEDDRPRPVWSMTVELPPDIDAEIRQYAEEEECGSWTVMIHTALYIYRGQFWTREQLRAEFLEAIKEGERSAETEGTIEATPQYWKEFKRRARRGFKAIEQLQAEGKVGNLLLPEELYEFVKERIASGECATPTDVVCEAITWLRKEREQSNE